MRGLLFFFLLFCSTGRDGVDPLTVCVNRQLQAPARQLFTRGKLFIFSLAVPALPHPRDGPPRLDKLHKRREDVGRLRSPAAVAPWRVPPPHPRASVVGLEQGAS